MFSKDPSGCCVEIKLEGQSGKRDCRPGEGLRNVGQVRQREEKGEVWRLSLGLPTLRDQERSRRHSHGGQTEASREEVSQESEGCQPSEDSVSKKGSDHRDKSY